MTVAARRLRLHHRSFLVLPIGGRVADVAGRRSATAADSTTPRSSASATSCRCFVFMVMLVPFFWTAAKRKPGALAHLGRGDGRGDLHLLRSLLALRRRFPTSSSTGPTPSWRGAPTRRSSGPRRTWDLVARLLDVDPASRSTSRSSVTSSSWSSTCVGLGGFMWAFAFWNNGATTPAGTAVEPMSGYGRPLVAKAKG